MLPGSSVSTELQLVLEGRLLVTRRGDVVPSSRGTPRPPLLAPPSRYVELPEHLGIEEGTRNCHRPRNPRVNDPYLLLAPGMLHVSDPMSGILSVDPSSTVVKMPWFDRALIK
mmetsp:Transcript_12408/g.29300  ORF Transcript_12408/g.29300 Transcript_12408/m.29300 type:complete len:113 (+) Transcript_12408:1347-1685(+)